MHGRSHLTILNQIRQLVQSTPQQAKTKCNQIFLWMPQTIVDQAAALIAVHLYRLLKTLLNNLDMLWRIGQIVAMGCVWL